VVSPQNKYRPANGQLPRVLNNHSRYWEKIGLQTRLNANERSNPYFRVARLKLEEPIVEAGYSQLDGEFSKEVGSANDCRHQQQ
jgi:hypothetical protein